MAFDALGVFYVLVQHGWSSRMGRGGVSLLDAREY